MNFHEAQEDCMPATWSSMEQRYEDAKINATFDLLEHDHAVNSSFDSLSAWQDVPTGDLDLDAWLSFNNKRYPEAIAEQEWCHSKRISAPTSVETWLPTNDVQAFGFSPDGSIATTDVSNPGDGPVALSDQGTSEPDSGDGSRTHSKKRIRARPYVCDKDDCGKTFEYPKDLKRHQRVHDESSRDIMCPVEGCLYAERGFRREDTLARHMRTQHPS